MQPYPSLQGTPIAVLGGDEREWELIKGLYDLGVELHLVGYTARPERPDLLVYDNPLEAVQHIKAVIAPMSNTNTDGLIQARLDHREPIDLTAVMASLPAKTPLFIGVAKPVIREFAVRYRLHLIETAEIDEVAIQNSIPTAEGAIQLAMEMSDITLHGSACLVTGYGRCGMTLAHMLDGLKARVTVAARDRADLARCREMGLGAVTLREVKAGCFDFIFNTVPALILDQDVLSGIKGSPLIIDLAAAPGGTDFEAAAALGLHAIHALSLPGKVAPLTAGRILLNCIPRLLEDILGGEFYVSSE